MPGCQDVKVAVAISIFPVEGDELGLSLVNFDGAR